MKNKLLLLIIILMSQNLMNAQFKPQPLKGTVSELPLDQRIKLDKIKAKDVNKSDVNGLNLQSFNPLDFTVNKQSQFIVNKRSADGEVLWMSGTLNAPKSYSWEQKCKMWIDEAADVMQINKQKNEFRIKDIWTDELSHTHIRLDQYHQGIKVYGAQIIIHGRNDRLALQNGQYAMSKKLPVNSGVQIDLAKAEKIVKGKLKNYHTSIDPLKSIGLNQMPERWDTELVYFEVEGEFTLAYHSRVYPNLGEHFEYFVDAQTGKVIRYFSTICAFHNHDHNEEQYTNTTPPDGPAVGSASDLAGSTRTINTYELNNTFFLIDASRDMFSNQNSVLPDDPVGVIWTIDLNNTSPINENAQYSHVVSGDNAWFDSPEGVSAHYNAGKAYDYFKQVHNREAITGTGQNIISFINVADEDGSSLGNAFWNGLGIYYGNGDNAFFSLGRALDVAGHEMSHGVIQSTANLEYFGESGAINESFADVFGSMIDRDDWLIGEDVVKSSAFPSGALRSMSDPHNGAATGDFGRGWQPKNVNEQYTGSEDNGGVHINSGIPNHAFYLLANSIGKDKAENIYYRALTTYLTRSSGFKELRFAVQKAAEDLYGNFEVNEAGDAFDNVGILEGNSGNFEEDIEVNPGQDLLLVSDQQKSNLLIFDLVSGNPIFDPLTNIDQLSKPSVTDDGSRIVFVGTDQHIYLTDIDWSSNPPTSNTFVASYYAEWRNAVISKDGNRVALLDAGLDNTIIVLDLPSNSQNTFTLTNPTYSEGLITSDVLYADAMEFDVSGNFIMYDAFNRIQGANSGELEFWDIGFLEVWNSQADTWALGRIDKLFGALPEGVSVGNPAFSKNSPFIIAMDFIDGSEVNILGVNIESGDIGQLFTNTTLGYPNYSRNDGFLIYDLDFLGNVDIGISQLNANKITAVSNSENILGPSLRWGTWFANGERILTSVDDRVLTENSGVELFPNPVENILEVRLTDSPFEGTLLLEMWDLNGRLLGAKKAQVSHSGSILLDAVNLVPGTYILSVRGSNSVYSQKFVKH